MQNTMLYAKQHVVLHGVSSRQHDITYRVPQGSILGPLLFILYINDITNSSRLLSFILFADDTNIFSSSNSLQDLENITNIELCRVSDWFKANKLSLNASKTHFVLFGNKPRPNNANPLKIIIDGKVLEQIGHSKFLGVVIDAKLNWKHHVNHVSLKISRGIFAIC